MKILFNKGLTQKSLWSLVTWKIKLMITIIFNRYLWDMKMPMLNTYQILKSKCKWREPLGGISYAVILPFSFIQVIHLFKHTDSLHTFWNPTMGNIMCYLLCRVERFRRNFLCPQKHDSLVEMRHACTVLTVQSLMWDGSKRNSDPRLDIF